MSDQTMPHDLEAEVALLGSCLMGRVGEVRDQVTPADFYNVAHGDLYALLVQMHDDGEPIDAVVIRDRLVTSTGAEAVAVQRLYIDAMSAAGYGPRVAAIVVRHAIRRRVLIASDMIRDLGREDRDPVELLDLAKAQLAAIDTPTVGADRLRDLSTIDEFMTTADTAPAPWVVPGLLRRGWRCMLVAGEGLGKSVATRQLAVCAAQGIHPFTGEPMPAVRTLIVDLENPQDAIADTCRPITARARREAVAYDEGRAWIWHQPGGINVRTRTDRANLEAVVAAVQPDLVCLGPIYKAYRVVARESDEIAAGEVQEVFDNLRTRFGFALMLEHHAPKAQGISQVRDLVPYGSSLWLRWPELGLSLVPAGDRGPAGSLLVGRWRHDRMKCCWPTRLDRGGGSGWPWHGFYADGGLGSA